MKLRNYQQAAVDAVIESWKKSRSCLIVLPTGCGKTVVFGEVIRRRLKGEERSRSEVEVYSGLATTSLHTAVHRHLISPSPPRTKH